MRAGGGPPDSGVPTGTPDPLVAAAGLRWSRPDLTAALADHVLETAADSGDRDRWLTAAGWAVHARAATGDGREIAADVIEGLTSWGADPLGSSAAGRLRVELALVAVNAGQLDAAGVLLESMAVDDISAELRADAFGVLARCAVETAPERVESLLTDAEQAWSETIGPFCQLGSAGVALVAAAAHRRAGRSGPAAERAAAGLARLDRAASTGNPAGHLAAALAAEWILALLDAGRTVDARQGCAELTSDLSDDGRPSRQLARLRLAVARTTAGESTALDTAAALTKAVRDAADSDAPDLEAVCCSALGPVYRQAGQPDLALATEERGAAARQLDRERGARLRAALATLPRRPRSADAPAAAAEALGGSASRLTADRSAPDPVRPAARSARAGAGAPTKPLVAVEDAAADEDDTSGAVAAEAPHRRSRHGLAVDRAWQIGDYAVDGGPAATDRATTEHTAADDATGTVNDDGKARANEDVDAHRRNGRNGNGRSPDPLASETARILTDRSAVWDVRWEDGGSPIGDILMRSMRDSDSDSKSGPGVAPAEPRTNGQADPPATGRRALRDNATNGRGRRALDESAEDAGRRAPAEGDAKSTGRRALNENGAPDSGRRALDGARTPDEGGRRGSGRRALDEGVRRDEPVGPDDGDANGAGRRASRSSRAPGQVDRTAGGNTPRGKGRRRLENGTGRRALDESAPAGDGHRPGSTPSQQAADDDGSARDEAGSTGRRSRALDESRLRRPSSDGGEQTGEGRRAVGKRGRRALDETPDADAPDRSGAATPATAPADGQSGNGRAADRSGTDGAGTTGEPQGAGGRRARRAAQAEKAADAPAEDATTRMPAVGRPDSSAGAARRRAGGGTGEPADDSAAPPARPRSTAEEIEARRTAAGRSSHPDPTAFSAEWLKAELADLDRIWERIGAPVAGTPSLPSSDEDDPDPLSVDLPGAGVEPAHPREKPATADRSRPAGPGNCSVAIDIARDGRRLAGRRSTKVMNTLADVLTERLPAGATVRLDEQSMLAIALPGWTRDAATAWMRNTLPGVLDGHLDELDVSGMHLRAAVHDGKDPVGAQLLQRLDTFHPRSDRPGRRRAVDATSVTGRSPDGPHVDPEDPLGIGPLDGTTDVDEQPPPARTGRRRYLDGEQPDAARPPRGATDTDDTGGRRRADMPILGDAAPLTRPGSLTNLPAVGGRRTGRRRATEDGPEHAENGRPDAAGRSDVQRSGPARPPRSASGADRSDDGVAPAERTPPAPGPARRPATGRGDTDRARDRVTDVEAEVGHARHGSDRGEGDQPSARRNDVGRHQSGRTNGSSRDARRSDSPRRDDSPRRSDTAHQSDPAPRADTARRSDSARRDDSARGDEADRRSEADRPSSGPGGAGQHAAGRSAGGPGTGRGSAGRRDGSRSATDRGDSTRSDSGRATGSRTDNGRTAKGRTDNGGAGGGRAGGGGRRAASGQAADSAAGPGAPDPSPGGRAGERGQAASTEGLGLADLLAGALAEYRGI